MGTPTEMMSALEEQVLEVIRQSQDAVVKAVKTWAEAGKGLVPDLPSLPSLPFADQIPAASELVEGAFDFAERMLAAQREFATAIIDAAAPALGATKPATVKPTAAKAPTTKIA